ncbi:uncharacterized protein LOC131160354 [Malania oleifera]|uniref:uncharacterized protein LOC131160354 n=1 Tax=Malania oleifera TaxID=397392 RepID=UPI0025ADF681|nr:uncharacterized protein LOC131160354 [Malania oleifera]
MGVRVGLLFLVVLGISWDSEARNLVESDGSTVIYDFSVMQLNYRQSERAVQGLEGVHRNEKVCTLCEEFTAEALDYLKENKTQKEIIDILHTTCSQMHSFSQQCDTLVDYYAPLFFSEIALIEPEDFCQKINLCEQMAIISKAVNKDSCEFCHQAVADVLLKLKDPDTQLEIIELLLKGCDSVENYVKKCKRLVFEYAPMILANAERFLETTDVCAVIHACNLPTSSSM